MEFFHLGVESSAPDSELSCGGGPVSVAFGQHLSDPPRLGEVRPGSQIRFRVDFDQSLSVLQESLKVGPLFLFRKRGGQFRCHQGFGFFQGHAHGFSFLSFAQERKSDPFSPPGLLSLSFSSVLVIGPFHQAILSEGLAVSCLPSAFPMVDASHLGNANPVPFFREA